MITAERAACGHFVRINTKPNAQDAAGRPLVLCPACSAALKKPKIERKA